MKVSRLVHIVLRLLPLVVFFTALAIMHHELKDHDFKDILTSLRHVPVPLLITALALTAVNYLVLAGYDWLALRYTGHRDIPLA